MQFDFGFSKEPQPDGILKDRVVLRRQASAQRPHPMLPGLGFRRIHKLFFAALPSSKAAADAFAIPSGIELTLPERLIVPMKNLHVTFHLVAQQEGIPESLREQTRQAISVVRVSSFDVTFDRLGDFALDPPRHALVLLCGQGLEPLIDLHRQIGTALRQAGFKRIGKSFVPHVTLAYNTEPFATPPITPISWTVDRFVLIESPHGKGKHLIQGRWILTDAERVN